MATPMTPKGRDALRLLWDATRDAHDPWATMPSQATAAALAPACRGAHPLVERAPAPPPANMGTTAYRLTRDGRALCRRLFGPKMTPTS